MVKVKDIMSREVIAVSPDTEIAQAAKLLLSKRINGVPVVNEAGNFFGVSHSITPIFMRPAFGAEPTGCRTHSAPHSPDTAR